MVSSASSFSDCLEFVSKFNVPLSLDICHLRHPTYLILPMPTVPTALHLHVAQIDDIIRPIATCNDIYKFVDAHIVFCRNLQLIVR